jgi:eukaryotic-like serine/threonine-protein kinase
VSATSDEDQATLALPEPHATGDRPEDVTVTEALGAGQAAPPRPVTQGSMIGRYVVLERLGEGGMGIVVRAYDSKLRREIALKLLRSDNVVGEDAEARMIREAQALAQLSHPNVVAVYDAELTEHGVCISMEYVQGRTLREWSDEAKRRWSEVVAVVLDVARGLAAAHAVDVIHRDVKPDNVLVGHDGRARLTDFGLARAREGPASSGWWSANESGIESSGAEDYGAAPLTKLGTVMGTPAYMAPEQHTGATADARSDQYALCVMLWEALWGKRPFAGPNLQALAEAKRNGPPERPSRGVPEWVCSAIRRGLSFDPDQRWPSIDALVDALASGQGRTRRRRVAIGLGFLACAAASGVMGYRWERHARVQACERAGESIAEVWNADARDALHTALMSTGVSHARDTHDRLTPWLEAYAKAWQTARTQVCLDAEVDGTWNDEQLDRGLWCLDERRVGFEALLAELSRGNPKSVEPAVQAVAALTPVDACLQLDLLERLPSPPTSRRDDVRDVRAELSKASALTRTGAYDEGLVVARGALARAQALDWPPIVASARLMHGALLQRTGEYSAAEAELKTAYFEAAKLGVLAVAVDAAEALVYMVGYVLARHEDGLLWSQHAEVAMQSLPDFGQMREMTHFDNIAGIRFAQGTYEEAKALNERALAIREATLGLDHPGLAYGFNNLANVHTAMGSYAEAQRLHERALSTWKETLGPSHPLVATSLSNLAGLRQERGAYDEALALHARAIAIREAAFGKEHPDVAASLNNMAGAHQQQGAYEEAKVLHERALAIREKAFGREHPDVAQTLHNLAALHRSTGAFEQARALDQRALAIRRKELTPDHPDLAFSMHGLGSDHAAAGEFEQAAALFEQALTVWENALGPEHHFVTYALVSLAETALARSSASEAIAPAQRAVTMRENAGSPAAELATARFVLARALWDAHRDRDRALELARQARAAYRDAGEGRASDLEQVDGWLARHGTK